MLSVLGKTKIFKIEKVNDKVTRATIYNSKETKKDSGEWKTTFVNTILVGKANDKIENLRIREKDLIEVKESMLQENEYTNKEGEHIKNLQVVIFDFELSK